MTLHVRTAGDPVQFAQTLRAVVRSLDHDLPLADVRTMTESLGIALLPARLAGTVLAVFGLLGLVLAAIGVYGVIAYNVAQRTREIGIRMAIGPAQARVVGALMRQGLTLVAIGAVFGLAAGWGVWRLVRGMLHGTSAPDLLTFAGPECASSNEGGEPHVCNMIIRRQLRVLAESEINSRSPSAVVPCSITVDALARRRRRGLSHPSAVRHNRDADEAAS